MGSGNVAGWRSLRCQTWLIERSLRMKGKGSVVLEVESVVVISLENALEESLYKEQGEPEHMV